MHSIRTAKLFLENKEQLVLLLRRSQTAPRRALEWDLPGGIIEAGEKPQAAVLRELREEAGISGVKIIKQVQIVDSYDEKIVERSFFRAECHEPVVVLSFEHDMYQWVPGEDVIDMLQHEPYNHAFKMLYK